MSRKVSIGKRRARYFDFLLGCSVAALVVLLHLFNFSPLRVAELQLYNLWMRLSGPLVPSGKIAIVAIDDESLRRLGRWPWPRSIHATLIRRLSSAGAKVIAPAIQFHEPEESSGLQVLDRLSRRLESLSRRPTGALKKLQEEMRRLREELDHDAHLEKAVRDAGNVVLLMSLKTDREMRSPDVTPPKLSLSVIRHSFRVVKNIGEGIVQKASACDPPLERFARQAVALGSINFPLDLDGVARTSQLALAYQEEYFPDFSLMVAAKYLGIPSQEMVLHLGRGVSLGNRFIPTDMQMRMFIRYLRDTRTFPYYSFADVLEGRVQPTVFRDKIVLIGFSAVGLTDRLVTPTAPRMPAVECVANGIENILRGLYLEHPSWGPLLEVGILLLLGLFTALVLPRLGAVMGATLSLVLMLGTALLPYLLFRQGLIVSLVPAMILLLMAYPVMISRRFFLTEVEKESVEEESEEANKMLGLAFQGKGMLDLAFEKFRSLPIDEEMKDILYNLALDFERKRMPNKAVSVYQHIATVDPHYRDIVKRRESLEKALVAPTGASALRGTREETTVMLEGATENPTLGRYEIVGELGKGAMGVVYKGIDPKIRREVAIKTIRFEQDFEPEEIEDVKKRFFREAEAAGRLTHPNIVTIYDVGEDWDLSYIAMEVLEGEDLRIYTRKGNLLPIRRAVEIVAQVCDALDYAHEQGVVHRDIKPANIMVLKDGRVKVTDFGIARITTGSRTQTAAGIVLGTPSYMSPEQVSGLPLDGRSDIFSLGVVFYELLTGERPFKGDGIINLLHTITQKPHRPMREINPKIPEFLDRVINRALAKNPDKRFQRASEMARVLGAFLARVDQLRSRRGKTDQPTGRAPT